MPPQNLKVQDITKIQLGDVLKNIRLFKHSFGDVKKVSDTIPIITTLLRKTSASLPIMHQHCRIVYPE